MKHQLIPAFKARYCKKNEPKKKMILILDNAPYHRTYTGKQVNLKGTVY